MLAYGTFLYFQATDSPSWPRADGRIVASEVVSRSSPGRGSSYKTQIEYTYSVRGKTLHGDRVRAAGGSYRNYRTARNVVNRYRPDNTITVYYDPDNPSFAVLEPGVTEGAFSLPVFGLAFVNRFCEKSLGEREERYNLLMKPIMEKSGKKTNFGANTPGALIQIVH